jgi:hypothetical protein
MKRNILSDSELFVILENGTFSSDKDFGFDLNDYNSDSFDDSDFETGNLPDAIEINNVNNNLCSVDNNFLSYNKNQVDWFTDPPVVENITFMGTPGLKCMPEGDQPID